MSERKADIIAVRPPGEPLEKSIAVIFGELKGGGFFDAQIQEGITQPDGSKIFNVYLKGE